MTTPQVIRRTDLQRAIGVSSETVRQWIKSRKLPPPDYALSRKSWGWTVETLRRAGITVW